MYTINKTGKEYKAREMDIVSHNGENFVYLAQQHEEDEIGRTPMLCRKITNFTKTYYETRDILKSDTVELVGVSYENFLSLTKEKPIEFYSFKNRTTIFYGIDQIDIMCFAKKENETLPEFFLRVLIKTQILTKKD